MFLKPPLRKIGSQNFVTMRPIDGHENFASSIIHGASAKVFGTDQKNHRWRLIGPPPPPVIGLIFLTIGASFDIISA